MKSNIKAELLFLIVLFACLCGNPYAAEAQDDSATIYILKNQGFGVIGNPTFMINDVEVGKLSNKSYYECSVPSGKLTVSVFFNNERQSVVISAKSGGKYYVCAHLKAFSTGGGRMSSSFSGGSSSNFGSGQAYAGSGHMISAGNVSYAVNITRLNDAQGVAMVKKCKSQLLADLRYIETEPAAVLDGAYAQQTPVQAAASKAVYQSDVDVNIPVLNTENKDMFVLIIANENYEFVDNVEFALHDGEIFREYCIKTLGVPERQVWMYKDASLGIISGGVDKMAQAMNIFDNAKAIVYYCGHGIPDEKTGDAYIVPVDGRGTNTATCYSLNQLYKTMASAKTSNVTYFMDACFTGANRDGSMLVAARGVAREAKKEVITGKAVVFSAASGDETAMPFKEKQHGMFTYYLLKKLQETKGNVTYGELAEYISSNVKKEAFLTNDKPQNPVVATSEEYSKSWRNASLR